MTREREGVLLCLASAAGFAAIAIFAKYAYAAGVNVLTLLALRFGIAAAALWLLARAAGAAGSGRALVAGALVGGLGYAAESGLFFGALTRLEASLASLVLYAYPALVLVGAVALGRDHADRARVLALTAATAGVALVVAGGDLGAVDGIGVLMALGAAAGYALYVLGSHAVSEDCSPAAFAAAVCTGACNAFALGAIVTGRLDVSFAAEGWLWIVALALASTVLGITAFLGGLQRVGPAKASILSTAEPPITLALAALCFGDRLAPLQLAGAALVVGAVALLHVRTPLGETAAAPPSPRAAQCV